MRLLLCRVGIDGHIRADCHDQLISWVYDCGIMLKMRHLAVLLTAIALVATVSCSSGSGTATRDGRDETGSVIPQDAGVVTVSDLKKAALAAGVEEDNYQIVERVEDGLVIKLSGSKTIEVGGRGYVSILISERGEEFSPERVTTYTQTSGSIIYGGPISETYTRRKEFLTGRSTFHDGSFEQGSLNLTCLETGPASVTFTSRGESDIEDPPKPYTTSLDFHIECIDEGAKTRGIEHVSGYLEREIGSDAGSLTWVTSQGDGASLHVSQITPTELAVGESAEVYMYYAAPADGRRPSENAIELLDNAEIDFNGGGPITIDSPPGRVAVPAAETKSHRARIYWGLRSATITCNAVGDGVYNATLEGERSRGDNVSLVASGIVDCVEHSNRSALALADGLDFTGVWARRPNKNSYVPVEKGEFPANTELHFDDQLCVARVSGIRACDVAYWVYGTDWIELSIAGEPEIKIDSKGNEELIVPYSGVYHHTHSYFGKTEMPDEYKHSEKDIRPTWDLGAGPITMTFEMTGTLSYLENRSQPLALSFEGTLSSEFPYRHGSTIGMGYSGPIPEDGVLPLGSIFRDEQQGDYAPEGLYAGSDRAYGGAFYAASKELTGAVIGAVKPGSLADQLTGAKVELFEPGSEEPLKSQRVGPDGEFEFTGLPIIRTDGETSGPPDVFATQYTIKVTEAEADVNGNIVEFQPRTITTRPFIEQTILVDPVEATHFIAVGDRGVGGTPIVFHYSLEYWRCDARFEPLYEQDGFTPDEVFAKCRELNPRSQPQKMGEVELLARTDYTVWAGVDDLTGPGRSWVDQSVWIAEIMYRDTAAEELMPIYAGTKEDVEERWAGIIETAQNYPYAEQEGFAERGELTQWPMSLYQPLGTNSNTFIRHLVREAGLLWLEQDGLHPGNDAPEQNTESYLGRPLTFYVAHTPWKGEAIKPEPDELPP